MQLLELPLPPDAAAMVVGDADGDGQDDLVVVTESGKGAGAKRVELVVVRFGADGKAGAPRPVDVGSGPLLWDVDHGLWAIDREGLVKLDPDGGPPARLARFPSVLAALGPATPIHGDFAHDLDGDGVPELFAWSAGRWLAFRAGGAPLGGIPAPAEGRVDLDRRAGAPSIAAALTPPPLVVADVDGDRRGDLLLPARDQVKVYFTGDAVGARAATLRLPLDLEPRDDGPIADGETRRVVADAWFEDLDGDGKADLAAQRLVMTGTFFGATTELVYARGTGSGFEPPRTVTTRAAAFQVRLLDVDGDGDRDFLAPTVDVGIANLARALLAREVRVDLALYRHDGRQLAAEATPLHALNFPVEAPDRLQAELSGDLDGDGRLDLVTNDGADRILVFRGVEGGIAAEAAWERAVPVPRGDDAVLVHDLTGDGRAEVVVWGPGRPKATVLRLP